MPDSGPPGDVETALAGRWQWQPDVVAILVGAAFSYVAIWNHQRAHARATRPGWRHLVAWLAGLAVVAVALLSPLAALDDQLFWIHMVQHELFIFAAPPLFLVGAAPLLKWEGPNSRIDSGLSARAIHCLLGPAGAFGCATAILWVWHAPMIYDLALTHRAVHRLEHFSFLAAYIVYWRPLMHRGSLPVLRTAGSRALYLLAGSTQSAVLGALLAFARAPYYTQYLEAARAWGFTPLADQQLGGAVMLFSGAAVCIAAAMLTIRGV